MDTTTIIGIITMVVTFILGLLSKKSKFVSNKLIPLQNLIIGLIACGVNYYFTKDWSTAIAGVGLFTGGVYDLGTNLNELFKKSKGE